MDIIAVLKPIFEGISKATVDLYADMDLAAYEKAVTDLGRKGIAALIGETLTELDQSLRDAPHRAEQYTIQRRGDRTLISTVGDIHFKHTLFQSRKDGSYHLLLDEMLKLPKDEHFTELGEASLLKQAATGSYQKAADQISVGGQKISKVAVMNKVHRLLEELPAEAPIKETKAVRELYIEADEDHIHRQKSDKNGCIIGKLVYLYEGKRTVGKGRNELVGTFYFGGSRYVGTEGNRAFWEHIQRFICDHYDTEVLKRVYIAGDGGAWISAGTEYIAKSCFVTDRFHLMKYLNGASRQMLSEGEIVKRKLLKYIAKNKLKKAQKLLRRMAMSAANTQPIQVCYTFLTGNWEAVRRGLFDPRAPRCSAEGHVSHLYSERMSSRPMGWSERGADRMCMLRCYRANKGDDRLIDLVKFRRERAYEVRKSNGTDGMEIEQTAIRKRYTQAQIESMKYAERMQAEISGTITRKRIAIGINRAWF